MEPLEFSENLEVEKEKFSLEDHTHYLTYSLSKQKNKVEEKSENKVENNKGNKSKNRNKKQEEIPESYYQVLNAYGLAAKNIRNSVLYLIRNFMASFQYEKEVGYVLKQPLHQNQLDMLLLLNETVDLLNQKRVQTSIKKIEKEKKEKEEQKNQGKQNKQEKGKSNNPRKPRETDYWSYPFYREDFVLMEDENQNESEEQIHLDNRKKFKNKDKNKNKEQGFLFYKTDKKIVIDQFLYYQILNLTFMETLLKLKESKETDLKNKNYGLMNSSLSQAILQKTCKEYKYYLEAKKDYFKTPSKYQGEPQPPGYSDKNEKITFTLSADRFSKDGKLLMVSKKHQLFTDLEKTENNRLKKETIDEFNQFNLKQLIESKIEKEQAKLRKENSALTLSLKEIEFVFNESLQRYDIHYKVEYKKPLKGFYSDLMKKAQADYETSFFKMKPKDQEKLMKEYFNQDLKQIPYVMGLDLGMVNFATASLYSQDYSHNYVISSHFLRKKLNKLYALSDQVKSNLFNSKKYEKLKEFLFLKAMFAERKHGKDTSKDKDKDKDSLKQTLNSSENINTPPINQVSVQEIKGFKINPLSDSFKKKYKDKKGFTREEMNQGKSLLKQIYQEPELIRIQERIKHLKEDFIHKISWAFVELAVEKNIQLIIVGKNEEQKQEINMGKRNNREFVNLPFARFIELLKYKALKKDIVVIETEESYTSKTSFIDHEPLMTYEGKRGSKKKEKKLKLKDKNKTNNKAKFEENNEDNKNNENQSEIFDVNNHKTDQENFDISSSVLNPVFSDDVFTVETTQENQPQWSGRRTKRKFITKNGQVIHADVNGAYNIIRKVLNDFKYEPDKINLNHRLLYLSSQGKGKHRFQLFSRAGIP